MDDLYRLTIGEAHQLLKRKQLSSVELTKACLKRLAQAEEKVHACITVCGEMAMRQAAEADKAIGSGKAKPLTGIPTIIKDNMCTRGIKTTCASRILENFVPPYNATVVEKLNAAGVVVLGKANMDEFAMGSSTENSAFFPTRNPWDLDRVPGGSSGGSAVAVAADEAVYTLGSDTGGSIRQPAGFCSVVGMKPTYGRVSRFGLVAFASSLDQIGPITKTVTDCALVMNVISGHDPRDSTSVPNPVPDYTKSLIPDLKKLRIGIPKEYLVEGMQPEVRVIMQAAIAKLEELGAEVDWNVSLPHTKYALAAYYILAPSEASANLARYDGVKYGFSYRDTSNMWEAMEKTKQFGFGAEVKRRIMLGTYALSAGYYDAYYLKAQKVRTLIKQEFDHAFEKYDALVTPTSPTVPFKLGERVDDPVQMYLSDICTLPTNIAGIPGISVPAGFVDGLPVGMQILGKHFDEATLLRIAFAYEQATDWRKKRPPM
ncbi:MAG: Asp-tRNA(Asn)/Glu-tRNA(Gln) amidotransferase subunit GatA [Chloroflexi bacterium]|nr:Asp-tRNA(Asn)/Glu-tRNA(Gln) amidotransferase subunit GatA [Chloroflexota bacterium]MBM3174203.1 Asp-tRNA(Asn)/Glu-tRNA(Gln) amidotransferase subunit GatA [Chloroflexota bacterium]MBM4449896.1 Asp-tRNA(Asn)/Glu-tRNA(Gln) amidotransferase subunit GatA [Chloroflexota bacterium]